MQTADFDPKAGEAFELAADLTLVLAPNPSPMTYLGTNTYVLGRDSVAVIDPGPASKAHLAALLKVIADRPVSHILLTHSHLDHSPLARPLAAATGAPVLAFGDSHAGRSTVMQGLADAGYAGGGEGMDWDFVPDQTLHDAQIIEGDGWTLRAVHTPGHIGNHLCYVWGDAVFTGDHVMGWATSLVSPPDGDMSDFMASCRKLQDVPATIYYPGHGAPVRDPAARLATLIAHRQERSAQLAAALKTVGPTDVQTLTKAIYSDVAPALYPAAARNVFATLVDLHQTGKVTAAPTLAHDAVFALSAVNSTDVKRK